MVLQHRSQGQGIINRKPTEHRRIHSLTFISCRTCRTAAASKKAVSSWYSHRTQSLRNISIHSGWLGELLRLPALWKENLHYLSCARPRTYLWWMIASVIGSLNVCKWMPSLCLVSTASTDFLRPFENGCFSTPAAIRVSTLLNLWWWVEIVAAVGPHSLLN